MAQSNRFLRAMWRLRMFFGPASLGHGAGVKERSEEQRAQDLEQLGLKRVVNPDGTSYLVQVKGAPKDATS